jgi:nitroimidazol reductase NimA-like FMN-containing flavoprotein (pyridoxamine 5'-phosphate oxidase superfamily)
MTHDAWLEDLEFDTCLRLLRENSIGRIAVVVDGAPIVLPVNYRLVETNGVTWLAVRTRPGNVLDRPPAVVALEVDAIDSIRQQGWSVLVRGTLQRVDSDAADFRTRFDSEPWLRAGRDAWLVIEPFTITGRQLHAAESEWAFHPRAYL